jgi:hypothetical protein
MITLILSYSTFVFTEYGMMQRQLNWVQKCRAYTMEVVQIKPVHGTTTEYGRSQLIVWA